LAAPPQAPIQLRRPRGFRRPPQEPRRWQRRRRCRRPVATSAG